MRCVYSILDSYKILNVTFQFLFHSSHFFIFLRFYCFHLWFVQFKFLIWFEFLRSIWIWIYGECKYVYLSVIQLDVFFNVSLTYYYFTFVMLVSRANTSFKKQQKLINNNIRVNRNNNMNCVTIRLCRISHLFYDW